MFGSDKKALGLGRVYFVVGECGRVTSRNCRRLANIVRIG